MYALCQCWCHEGPAAQAQLWPYQRGSDAPEVASVRDLEGPPAILVDPEALRLVEEIASYSAPVVRAAVTAKEALAGADVLSGVVRSLVEEKGYSLDTWPPPAETVDRHHYLAVTVVVPTYGTADQARATAERVRRMLSVELHQPVVYGIDPYDLLPFAVEAAAQRQGCSCYDDLANGGKQGPVTDADCKVHGKHAR